MATIRRLRGRWQAMVRRRGVPPRCKSFDKRTDATRWARELEAEADRSGWVADTRLAEKTTLGELLTRYRDQVSPTKRSALTERSRINAMLRRQIVHRTLAKLTSADIATYRDERLKNAAPVHLAKRIVHLPLTKNGESRDVPLSRRATETLTVLSKNRQPNADLVFPMSGNSVRLAFERLRARAKMSDFHFHDLRHEAITRLFERGLNIAEVSAISGHKELRMLQRYTHLRAIDLVSRLG
jgi:integrase